MILGYKKLKDCEPGQLVRLWSGSYLLLSEYRSGTRHTLDSYISGSGEAFANGDAYADEWVAIIDLDWIEVNLEDDLDYPGESIDDTTEANDSLPSHLIPQYLCEYCQETTNEPDMHRYCKPEVE